MDSMTAPTFHEDFLFNVGIGGVVFLGASSLHPMINAGAPVFVQRVFADGEETAITLNVPRGTRSLLVDPYHTVLTAK